MTAPPTVASVDPAAARPRSALISLGGAAVSGAFGFLLAVVITRGFGPVGAGGIFTAIGILTVVGAVCCLGADTGAVWALPRRRTGPGGEAARLMPVALGPPLVVSAVVGVVGVLSAGWIAGILFDGGGASDQRLVALTFAAVPFLVAMTILLSATRATRPITAYVCVQFLLLPVSRPILVLLVAFAGGSVLWGMAAWTVPIAVALLVCVALVVPPLGIGRGASLRPDPADWRTFWGFALPRAVSAAIDAGSMWVGVLMTAALAGQAEAGVFGAVGRYVLAGLLAMQGLRVAFAPQLSKLLGDGRPADAAALHRETTVWIVALSWPLYLMLAVFAPAFLALFGPEFTTGAGALAVLSAAMLVKVGLGNVQTLLLMSGHSGRHLLATTLGLGTTLALGFWLIPAGGALGAAIAWGCGIVVENVVAAAAARTVIGEPILSGSVLRAAGVVVAGCAVASGLGLAVGGRGVTGLVVALAALAVLVVASLAVPAVRREARVALRSLKPGGARGAAGTAAVEQE